MTNQTAEVFGEVIYSYTREQALEDGVLVDVSGMAKEAGFKFSVAITSALHNTIENIPDCRSWEDYQGRLWDVLLMAAVNAKRNPGRQIIQYELILHHNEDRQTKTGHRKVFNRYITLKMHIGPGDNGEPVITIMLPSED